MRTATKLDYSQPIDDCIDGNEVIDRLRQKPELPSPEQRWTVRRKATVIEAARRGLISIDELTRRYSLSIDELVAWERDLPFLLNSDLVPIEMTSDRTNRPSTESLLAGLHAVS